MSVADEWFADFLRRCVLGGKRTRVLREWQPQPHDVRLRSEREYDAQTDYLRGFMHGEPRPNGNNQYTVMPGIPLFYERKSA